MSTPAPAPAPAPAAAAVNPGDADMIEAMFRAFASLIPGNAAWKFTPGQVLEHLALDGAAGSDLAVIRDWLAARENHDGTSGKDS